MEFHDYIIDYTLQNDENIIKKTTEREEFYELSGSSTERTPEQGDFFKHQKIFARYLRQYDKLLNIHETGTGKTGSIIYAAELFKTLGLGLKRVVILHPGDVTSDDFRSQIIKYYPSYIVTTGGEYDVKATNKKIGEWYSLNTYEKFGNEIRRMSNLEMIGKYSDTLFFLDEAHRLRNYKVTENEEGEPYRALWFLLHMVKRSKTVISTATPMVNGPNDFVPLLNMLLPPTQQLDDLDKSGLTITLEDLEPIFRGKITYVKALDTGVKLTTVGEVIDHKHLIKNSPGGIRFVEKNITGGVNDRIDTALIGEAPPESEEAAENLLVDSKAIIALLPMVDRQLEVYNTNSADSGSFGANINHVGIFVFPDGTYGNVGYNRNVSNGKLLRSIEQEIKRNLHSYSTKFNFFIDKELEASKQEKPGNSFCYLENVNGSGVNLLGIIMTLFGFEKFTRESPLFDRNGKMRNGFVKKHRYVIITSETPQAVRNCALEVFNSKENVYGEYIQIIVASKTARDGINISNVKRGYIMSPTWHEAGMYQAQSRFIRATSHDELKKRGEDLNVKVYRLASHSDKEREISNTWSEDVVRYMTAERKSIITDVILTEMKKASFDYYLNYNRNFTTQNEVIKTQIQTIGDNLISNTKKVLYHKEKVDILENHFKILFDRRGVVTQSDMINWMNENNMDEYYLHLFNERINNTKIVNMFGNVQNIETQVNTFFKNTIHLYNPSELNRLTVETEVLQEEIIEEIYNKIKTQPDDKSKLDFIRDFMWSANNMEVNQTIMQRILEMCLIKKEDQIHDINDVNILFFFRHYIGVIKEYPTDSVEKVKRKFDTTPNSKPGRKPGKNSKTLISDLTFKEPSLGTQPINFHFFHPIDSVKKVGSTFSLKSERVPRILHYKSNGFVDGTVYETPVFLEFFRNKIRKWENTFKDRSINLNQTYFGTYQRDSQFRLVELNNKNTGRTCTIASAKNNLKDINLIKENKILEIILPFNIVDKMKKILVMGKEELEILINKNLTEDIKQENKNNNDVNTLRRIYFWYGLVFKEIDKKYLCQLLMNYLDQKKLMLYTL